jgi:hypothetical protein
MKSTKKVDSATSLISKLSPSQIRLSPKMRWIIDSLTGQDHGARGPRGEAPAHLSVTSDGYVQSGSMFLGDVGELSVNVEGVLQTISVTPEERKVFDTLRRQNLTDWRL